MNIIKNMTISNKAIASAAQALAQNLANGKIKPGPMQVDERGELYPDVQVITHMAIIADGQLLVEKLYKAGCSEAFMENVQACLDRYSQDGRFDRMPTYDHEAKINVMPIINRHLEENLVLIPWYYESYQF